MVLRMVAVVKLFCVLSVCVTPSKSLPQREEISQGKVRCDNCEDLKANAPAVDFPRSPKQSSESDLPSKNISESTKAEDTKKVEKLLPEDCKFNCTRSSETPDETVRKISRSASAEEEEFGKIQVPGTAIENPFAADSDQKMKSTGKPGGFNERSLNSAPFEGYRALTDPGNKTHLDDKPVTDTVTLSMTTVTPLTTTGIPSNTTETSSTTATETPSITQETPSTTTVSPASTEKPIVTGTEPTYTETTAFPTISTTPVTIGNEEESDLLADFIEELIKELGTIYSIENIAQQIEIMEQEITDFFQCLIQYADLRKDKPLRKECGNSMNEQLFKDLMDYINPLTESDFYGLEDMYADLEDMPQRSGFRRKAENDSENGSGHQSNHRLPAFLLPNSNFDAADAVATCSDEDRNSRPSLILCQGTFGITRPEPPEPSRIWQELNKSTETNHGMGSLPALSILKGPKRPLTNGWEPTALHRIFETTVSTVEKIAAVNNNQVETIHSIEINESVAQQTALISETGATTFSELNSTANRLGRAILKNLRGDAQQGNDDGDVLIAVCIKPSEELVTTLLAIWKIGAAYLPLDAAFPKNRVRHILDESRPVMVIVDDFDIGGEFSTVKYSELRKMGLSMSEYNIPEEDTLTKKIPRQDLLAAVLYTSGSTGVPKGVRIPHSAILNRLKWQWRTFPYSSTEKVCVFKTALTFVDSVCELWGPLLNARSVVILSKEDTKNPEKLTTILEKYEVERLILVPTLLQSILLYASLKKSNNDFLPKLRLWVCSGETLSVSLARSFYECFDSSKHSLCNFYGSTEVMGDVTYHVIASGEELAREEKVPIGKPLDNCTIYILDKDHRPVNMNQVGELYVSGMNLAAGYVRGRDPEKFLDNPLAVDSGHVKLYKTGDFARVVKNTVHYEGRADSQIKIRGHRVDLSEIELAIAKMTEIDKYVVLTYNPGEVNQAILAFVTVRKNTTAKVIEEYLSSMLAPYMVPQVIVVDHFPLLVNGKVDRQYFLKKYREEYSSETNSSTVPVMDYAGVPVDKMEKARALFETTLSVLGRSLRSSITTNSNFYHLGGNSLNSVYTVTKLRELGFIISIGDFISAPTLWDVINKMEEESRDAVTEELNTDQKYRSELLSNKHKSHVYNIITSSFYEKADLESHLVPPVPMSDYVELMDALWPHLLEKNLSFVAIDSNDDIKGAALNFDAHDEPDITIGDSNRLNVIFEFLEFLEGPIRDEKLPKGKNKVLHSFMMGTRTDLKPQETIEIIYFMEEEVLKLAEKRNFFGVLTSNTNALTQQLGCDVNKYESLLDYQVNKYVASDGSEPFGKAPDSQRTIVSWKAVNNKSVEF